MRKRGCLLILGVALGFVLGACQNRIFGVDEAVWNTLNENERAKVIDGYNKRKEIELAYLQKQREKELENQRHLQEIEAQTAPIFAAADAVSAIWGNANSRTDSGPFLRIESISSKNRRQLVIIEGKSFEVSGFSKLSQAWVKGQKVELVENKDDLFYPVKIRNMENGESVNARKSR